MTNPTVVRVQRAVWDLVLTIILLVATFVGLVVAGFFDLFLVAFTDYCPEPCHAGQGISAVLVVLICMAAVALAATIFSIYRLVHRRRAWWVALIALLVDIAGAVLAFVLYASIVG
jgi:Kef-type K+ transport system membrane component KefB